MADLMTELKEDLWQERITRFLQRSWRHIIILFILSVLVLALYQWNHSRQVAQREKSGELFHQAVQNLETGSFENLIPEFKALDTGASDGYKELSQLHLASIYHKGGKADDALNVYNDVAKNGSDVLFRDMGSILAAKIYMQKDDFKSAVAALEKPSKKDHPWRYSALELLALSEMELNNVEAAKEALMEIKKNPDAPKTLYERSLVFLNAIAPESAKEKDADDGKK